MNTPKSSRRHALVGSADLWQLKRKFQISFLRTVGLRPENYLLDIGCGTLRGGIPIIAFLDPGHYYGIDCRPDVLREASLELSEYGLTSRGPTLVFSPSLTDVNLDRQFDIIWGFSLLFHLSDPILDQCLLCVSRHLTPNGTFYANVDTGIGQGDGGWLGFPFVQRSASFYARRCEIAGLVLEDVGSLADFGHIEMTPQPHKRMLKITRA